MRRKVIAKRDMILNDGKTEKTLTIKKGETGELLGGKRPGIGYTVIIGEKTLYIAERRHLRYFFKIEEGAGENEKDNATFSV